MEKQTYEKDKSFLARFYIFQKERFPFIAHGILIFAFTFSAISYSLLSTNQTSFIPLFDAFIGFYITFTLFLLLRISDEIKDYADDVVNRPYLPVPRGLISIKELKLSAGFILVSQLSILVIFQIKMLYLYLIVLVFLALMFKEFFIKTWLKKHQIAYITSHMLIIPLIDFYASGLDWNLSGTGIHTGILWFCLVSFFNGIVLEFGRKINLPENEEVGVRSYSFMYGTRNATLYWLLLLFFTFGLTFYASIYANLPQVINYLLFLFVIICGTPALLFLFKLNKKRLQLIEIASYFWSIMMYFLLGIFPMIMQLLL